MEIKLKDGNVALVDVEDYERLNGLSWWIIKGRNDVRYAAMATYGNKSQQTVRMHRMIMGLKHKDGLEVDHINGDGLDNRKDNLRICSSQQNRMNRGPNKNRSSKYKGLRYIKKNGKWVARISIKGKMVHLGTFLDEKKAAACYNEAALKYYGEFAKLNEV